MRAIPRFGLRDRKKGHRVKQSEKRGPTSLRRPLSHWMRALESRLDDYSYSRSASSDDLPVCIVECRKVEWTCSREYSSSTGPAPPVGLSAIAFLSQEHRAFESTCTALAHPISRGVESLPLVPVVQSAVKNWD